MDRYILPANNEIVFYPGKHEFTNLVGVPYQSWSKVANTLTVPFDAHNVSLQMAQGVSRVKGITVEQAQSDILTEWEGKRLSSEYHGNRNHGMMEKFAVTGETSPEVADTINFVADLFKESYHYYPEFKLYSHNYRKAGIADLVIQRQRSWQTSVFDIYDYKTNEQKGIQFDSISRKKGIKHANRFLLPPFNFIEACNFALYSFQLCSYAYMLWEMYSIQIGRLAIIFIDALGKPTVYPVLYNPLIVQAIFTNYNELKELPIESDRLM
jgi:hypothetical protein